MQIDLRLIKPSSQPIRSSWDEEKMQELAQSIKEQGVIVPVKVRPNMSLLECRYHGFAYLDGDGVTCSDQGEICERCSELRSWVYEWDDKKDQEGAPEKPVFELVYGHRRAEAARRAGLGSIPAVIEDMEDRDSLVQALIENVQREDMNVLDKARAIQALITQTGWNNEEIQRRGIMHNTGVGQLLAFLSESDAGNVPIQEVLEESDPREQGLRKTLEVRRSLGEDGAAKKAVLKKAFSEGLSASETRRVADVYKAAKTDDERAAVLKVRGDHPAFERAVQVQAGVDMAETIRERKETRKHQENDREVAQFFEAARAFMTMVETMMGAIDFGKFSPEGARFAVRRIDSLIAKLQELKEQLSQ